MARHETLESALKSAINEVKSKDGLESYVYSIKKSNLDKLEGILSPSFQEINGLFTAAFRFDSDQAYTPELYKKLDFIFNDIKNQLSISYKDLNVSISVETKSSGNFSKSVSINKDNEMLLKAVYGAVPAAGRGEIKLYFGDKLEKDLMSSQNAFLKVWEEMILDDERVLGMVDSYLDELDLDSEEEPEAVSSNQNTFIESRPAIRNGGADLWSKLGGYEETKKAVETEIMYPLLNKELYNDLLKKTMKFPGSVEIGPVLFYGPPGTGKTTMAQAIAAKAGIEFKYLKLSDLDSKYLGESTERLVQAMNWFIGQKDKNTLLFIDEIDSIGSRNSDDSSAGDMDNRRFINSFLNKLDEVMEKGGSSLIVVGATNDKNAVDSAIISRFKNEIYFPLPSKSDRAEILSLYTAHLEKDDIDRLANATDGLSCRDIKNMSENAIKTFLRNYVQKKTGRSIPGVEDYLSVLKDMSVKANTNGVGYKSLYS